MSKKFYVVMILAAFLAVDGAVAPVFGQRGGVVKRDAVPMPTVNTDSVMKHIIELSSETYEGRMAGSAGFDRAADYVGRVMEQYGAKLQKSASFAVECNEVENCKFNVRRMPLGGGQSSSAGGAATAEGDRRVFTLGNEFCCAGVTGRGYVDAQMVFCGYGVDDGSFNEYRDVDVKGKVVVVLTAVPNWLPTTVTDRYRTLRDKARTAERHGAIGMLAINVSTSCLPDEAQARVWCGELPHLATFPILHLTLDCGREIFDGEKKPLDYCIDQLGSNHKIQSFSLLKKCEIDVNARYRQAAPTGNVVALLEGSDKSLAKEYIVVGACLDGQGIQGETCLFPGADINASGVATLLETARVLSSKDIRPKRSVLFVFFSGGEQQFLGSRVFVQTYPQLRRVEAFVGVQNVGYGDSVVVLGNAVYPALCDIPISRDTVAGRRNVVRGGEPTMLRGDARAFDAMGIPSMVVTTHDGMHYTRVTGDMWENIDRRILGITAQLVAETVAELGEGLYMGRSLQSKGERRK